MEGHSFSHAASHVQPEALASGVRFFFDTGLGGTAWAGQGLGGTDGTYPFKVERGCQLQKSSAKINQKSQKFPLDID
jgi:hypothetical protein